MGRRSPPSLPPRYRPMPTGRSSPSRPTTSAATCPQASRSRTRRPAGRAAVAGLRERGLRPGASRGDAAREPPRARPAHAGAERASACAACRSIRTTGPARPPICSSTASPIWCSTLAAREAQVREALAQSAHKPPVVAVGGVAAGRCRKPSRPAAARRRRPRRPPASSTPPAPPGGRRAASSRTATRSRAGAWYALARRPGDAPPGPGAHLQSAAALSRQRRRRVAHGRDRSPAIARSSPTASIRSAGGARSPRRGRPSCTISASSRRCCWASRRARTSAAHGVRFGLGAGIEPQLHAPFEERFGFPLIELWGMTEMVRVLGRQLRAAPGRHARLRPGGARRRRARRRRRTTATSPDGTAGRDAGAPLGGDAAPRLLLRLSRRRGGDGGGLARRLVPYRRRRSRARPDGMLHFVDRKKNIIRRSGENIAAAEIEARAAHPPRRGAGGRDGGQGRAARGGGAGLRGAEAAACRPSEAAEALFEHCYERLAYYKAPGWLHIVDTLPTTGTQKIQKHTIYRGRHRSAQHPRHHRPARAQEAAARVRPVSRRSGGTKPTCPLSLRIVNVYSR